MDAFVIHSRCFNIRALSERPEKLLLPVKEAKDCICSPGKMNNHALVLTVVTNFL